MCSFYARSLRGGLTTQRNLRNIRNLNVCRKQETRLQELDGVVPCELSENMFGDVWGRPVVGVEEEEEEGVFS
jgi:hypothetical protein